MGWFNKIMVADTNTGIVTDITDLDKEYYESFLEVTERLRIAYNVSVGCEGKDTPDESSGLIKPDVMHRFIPQPFDIEKLMKEKLEHRMINDEFGWTGEWRMSAKDVLDVIIDLQNGA